MGTWCSPTIFAFFLERARVTVLIAELFKLLYHLEEIIEFACAMISGHEVKTVLATAWLLANHADKGIWTTGLANSFNEAQAAILARIVHQAHPCILVLVGKNFVLDERKVRRVQFVASLITMVPYACTHASNHGVNFSAGDLSCVLLDFFYSPNFTVWL